MSAGQSAVSFLCAAVLTMFIVVRRVREDVAKLALVAWLLGCNLVHGINAAIWSSNADPKAFGWCDVVTKLVLATTVAVPGACLCISRYLEAVSSSRSIPFGAKALRNRRLVDAFFCYLIPFIYMPIHIIGQNYRFDLVKGIGCMASVHPSTPASMIVWIPHIAMCIFSILFSGMAIHNSFRHPTTHFSVHLESRSTMTASLWTRTLAISMTVTGITLLVLLFSMFSLPMSEFWISWEHVHEHFSEVNTINEGAQGVKAIWWGLRVITLCYIVLALVLGEESRDIIKYISGLREKKPSITFRPLITLCRRKDYGSSRSPSLTRPGRPVTLELRSGWDDDLDVKSTRLSPKGWKKSKSSPLSSPSPSPSSRTAEESFMKSTMPSLGSPLGNSLGYNAPVLPPPIHIASRKPEPYMDNSIIYEARPSPVSPSSVSPFSPTRPLIPKNHRLNAESKGSNIAAVLQEHWPSPPTATLSPVPSPIPSTVSLSIPETIDDISPTRASSPALSIDERRQPCSYFPCSSPPYMARPFEGSSIRSFSPPPEHAPLVKKQASRRPSMRSIRSTLSRERCGYGQPDLDVIHMTVVHETV